MPTISGLGCPRCGYWYEIEPGGWRVAGGVCGAPEVPTCEGVLEPVTLHVTACPRPPLDWWEGEEEGEDLCTS